MKITLGFSSSIYRACSLFMNIFNGKMVKVVLYMASNVVKYRCIPIALVILNSYLLCIAQLYVMMYYILFIITK